jgi:hypothetical protein
MKQIIYTLLFVLTLAASAGAQSVFSQLHPNPASVTATPDVLDAEAHMEFPNPTGDSLHIGWQRVEINFLPGMTSQICDPILCWAPHIGARTYKTGPNELDTLIVHFINHEAQEGSSIVHLKLTNLNNPSDTATAVFLYNPTTDTKDPLPAANIKLFPNPTVDFFLLERAEAVRTVRLFGLDGRQVMTFDAVAGHLYSLAGLPAGTYIVALEDARGRVFQAMEVRKQ